MSNAIYTRQFEVSRASVNPSNGTFKAILFTDGEASDGHILNIRGGTIPSKMPLFVNHDADPTTQLGSLHFSHKTEHQVNVNGEIFLHGKGTPQEVREDLLAKMAAGHVSRMSGRWDAHPENTKRRVQLSPDHPAFVDETREKDSRRLYGLYFDKWHAMEGSIVGLNADPQAVMRWASEEGASEPVREFWRSQVPDAQKAGVLSLVAASIRDAMACGVPYEMIVGTLESVIPLTTDRVMVSEEIEEDDSLIILSERLEGDLSGVLQRLEALEKSVADLGKRPTPVAEPAAPERENKKKGTPFLPSPSPRELVEAFRAQLHAAHQKNTQKFRDELLKARGGRT